MALNTKLKYGIGLALVATFVGALLKWGAQIFKKESTSQNSNPESNSPIQNSTQPKSES